MNWLRRISERSFFRWKRPPWLAFRRNCTERDYVSPTILAVNWLDAVAGLVFTPQGRILLIAFLPIAMFALLLTRSPAFLLFLLMLVLFLLDWVCKLFFPRRLRIDRMPPVRVSCGIPFEIRTLVRNDSFLPAYDFQVSRNLIPVLEPGDPNAAVYCLGPHSELLIRESFRLKRRGVYELPPPIAEGLFPFRLVKAVRRGSGRQEIICHPVYSEFRNLRLPGGRIQGREMGCSVNRAGESPDFLGCREYFPGDDPRRIHWRSSAKRNRLTVKEFQEEVMAGAAVILDNYCPPPSRQLKEQFWRAVRLKSLQLASEPAFEAAVSLTASIACSLSARNFVIDVFASGSEIHHFRTGRNTMSFEAFLDLLSSLEGSRSEKRFDRLPASVLNRIAASGAVFLILLRIDPESEKLYRELLRRGAAIRVLTFDRSDRIPDWAERISCEEILEGRRTEL